MSESKYFINIESYLWHYAISAYEWVTFTAASSAFDVELFFLHIRMDSSKSVILLHGTTHADLDVHFPPCSTFYKVNWQTTKMSIGATISRCSLFQYSNPQTLIRKAMSTMVTPYVNIHSCLAKLSQYLPLLSKSWHIPLFNSEFIKQSVTS